VIEKQGAHKEEELTSEMIPYLLSMQRRWQALRRSGQQQWRNAHSSQLQDCCVRQNRAIFVVILLNRFSATARISHARISRHSPSCVCRFKNETGRRALVFESVQFYRTHTIGS
jgi:hypothetical protein